MKKLFDIKILALILGMIFVCGTVDTLAQKRKPVVRRAAARKVVAAPATYRVDSGTSIRVRMNGTLNSSTSQIGDKFTTTVTEPVYSSTGVVVIPTGSSVIGRVDSVKAAKKGGDPGQIGVSFTSVRLPNGRTRAINGSLTGLDSKKAKSDNEGTASGDDRKNDKLIFIGGGGAGGAILGGAVGGGKGALIGGILGAGAGLLGERLTKGENAEVKSGTEFSVYLNQSVSMPRYVEANQ